MNVFIYLSSPSPQTYPQTQSTARLETRQRENIGKLCGGGVGWGLVGEAPLTPEILAPSWGPSVQFHNTYRPISRIEVAWCFDSSFACAFVP